MPAIIAVKGLGTIWSKGLDTFGERMKVKGWEYKSFSWYEGDEVLEAINEASPPIVLMGHSMGVNTIDREAEESGKKIDLFVSLDSAFPEAAPDNVDKVLSVVARPFGRFHVTGGRVNLQRVIKGTHTTIDDSEKLHDYMEEQLQELLVPKTTPDSNLELAEIELGEWLDPANESVWDTAFYGAFFLTIRSEFGRLSQPQINGIKSLIWAWMENHYPDEPIEYLAAILGNVHWETGSRMIPVRETFADNDQQAITRLDNAWKDGKLPWVKTPYWRSGYFGRGQLQVTHKENYRKVADHLWSDYGIVADVDDDPNLMLNPVVSALAAMMTIRGIYTGRAWKDYMVPGVGFDFLNSRKVVNGDVALNGPAIARMSRIYFKALEAGLKAADGSIESPKPPVEPPKPPIDHLAYLTEILELCEENHQMLMELTAKMRVAERMETQRLTEAKRYNDLIEYKEEEKPMSIGYIWKMLGALVGGGGFAALANVILPAPLATPEFINALTVIFAAVGTYLAPRNDYTGLK